MKKVIKEEQRNCILQILNANYPNRVGEKVIVTLLDETGHELGDQEVIQHLYYLEEKGFVTVEEVLNAQTNMKRTLAKITAKGLDYYDSL